LLTGQVGNPVNQQGDGRQSFRDCQIRSRTVTNTRMPSVAEQLRQAREQQKLSVDQVAEATKIRTDHVHALEAGNYETFAAPVYIRGFVRTYATLLRLDVPNLIQTLDTELSQSARFSEFSSLPVHQSTPIDWLSLRVAKVHWRMVLGCAAVILIVGLGIWAYRASRRARAADPLSNLGPGLYQPRQSNSGEMLPVPAPAAPQKP